MLGYDSWKSLHFGGTYIFIPLFPKNFILIQYIFMSEKLQLIISILVLHNKNIQIEI